MSFVWYAPAVEWLEKTVAEDAVILPGYVVMELIQGARNRDEQEKMRKTIEGYAFLWPSEDTCKQAAEVLTKYHRGDGIGIIDALMGQLALDMGLPIIPATRSTTRMFWGSTSSSCTRRMQTEGKESEKAKKKLPSRTF
jgi:hypothetical protein